MSKSIPLMQPSPRTSMSFAYLVRLAFFLGSLIALTALFYFGICTVEVTGHIDISLILGFAIVVLAYEILKKLITITGIDYKKFCIKTPILMGIMVGSLIALTALFYFGICVVESKGHLDISLMLGFAVVVLASEIITRLRDFIGDNKNL